MDLCVYKIVMAGDAEVGKTHIFERHTRSTLPKAPAATVGIHFAALPFTLPDNSNVRIQIWDTAGQERYRSTTAMHYRRAVGAILVYDITRKSSFENAAKWLEIIRQEADSDIAIILVGNKLDLVEQDPSLRQVPFEKALQFAQLSGLIFMEASAVTNYNIKKVFDTLIHKIYNTRCTKSDNDTQSYLGLVGVGPGVILDRQEKRINLTEEATAGCC